MDDVLYEFSVGTVCAAQKQKRIIKEKLVLLTLLFNYLPTFSNNQSTFPD